MKPEKQSSNEALRAQLTIAKDTFTPRGDWPVQAGHILGRNDLDTDLGRYSDYLRAYGLDVDRDRLIAHARQDASEAVWRARSLR